MNQPAAKNDQLDAIYFLTTFGRIGQVTAELFIALNPAIHNTSRTLVVHPAKIPPPNQDLYNILRRYYLMEPRADYFELNAASNLMLGNREVKKLYWEDEARCSCRFMSKVQYEGIRPVFYALSPQEQAQGQALQKRLGIPDNEPFVSLHIREPGYIKLDHHDHRNAKISTYLPAIDYLLKEGYWVVRLGDRTMTPLPAKPRLIDLPFINPQHNLLDIWFATRCQFMLANTSGPVMLPLVFNGPPRLMVNWIEGPTVSLNPQDRYIIKLIRAAKDANRLLTFRELMFFGNTMLRSERYQEAGLQVIDNSAQDILDAVIEMVQEIRTGRSVQETSPLQAKYRAIALEWHKLKSLKGECEPAYLYGPPVSNTFLEKYPQLLND